MSNDDRKKHSSGGAKPRRTRMKEAPSVRVFDQKAHLKSVAMKPTVSNSSRRLGGNYCFRVWLDSMETLQDVNRVHLLSFMRVCYDAAARLTPEQWSRLSKLPSATLVERLLVAVVSDL